MEIRENVPLAPLTTFNIGGEAQFYTEVANEGQIRDALGWAREKGVGLRVIAGGSNLLVPDEGLDGLIMRIVPGTWRITGATLEASAGCNLLDLIRKSASEGLGGWESMAGIPGSIGGAVRGNAGAFGTEIKDVLTWARVINIATEDTHEFSNAECEFSYRMSYFKKHPEWIITDVHVKLTPSESADALVRIEQTIAERERRHIQNVQAAGSYFMNPVVSIDIQRMFEKEKGVQSREGRVPAGWLIEKVGLKGARVGGAEASAQHPNYLKNANGATAAEVRELAEKIKVAVRAQFGVELIEEAVVINR